MDAYVVAELAFQNGKEEGKQELLKELFNNNIIIDSDGNHLVNLDAVKLDDDKSQNTLIDSLKNFKVNIYNNASISLAIYAMYKVIHNYTFSYFDPDLEDFIKNNDCEIFEIDGGRLLEIIAKHLNNRDISETTIRKIDNRIVFYFQNFDPSTGKADEDEYIITEIYKETDIENDN